MNLKEKLAALKEQLAALKERIEKDDKDAIAEGVKLQGEIAQVEADIQTAEQKASLLSRIGAKRTDAEGEKTARTLGENFVSHLKKAGAGKRFDVSAPEFKAATDVQTTPTGIGEFATTLDRNVVTKPRTELAVRDLFGAETISGSALVYLVEGAVEGTPAATAEGGRKPQIHFADPTPVTVTLEKIACFIKESDEYIKDYAFLESAINGRLLYELGLAEQNALVTKLLATSGIQTESITDESAVAIADLILKAAMDVQSGSGFAADAIVMNPATWYKLRVARTEDGAYYGGGFFGAQNVPNLWGIPVCVTTAVTANQIVVGAFKTCGSVVNNGGVGVEAVNTNEDDFIKNLMTIRAEERLALAVRRPAGFKVLSE